MFIKNHVTLEDVLVRKEEGKPDSGVTFVFHIPNFATWEEVRVSLGRFLEAVNELEKKAQEDNIPNVD